MQGTAANGDETRTPKVDKVNPKPHLKVSQTKPPDGGWGWFVAFGASLGHFLLVGLARTLGVFYVAWTEKFQGSAAATAWVQSMFNTIRMVVGPGVSMLCDKFGCRPVVMTGGVVFCTACVISAFATSLTFLYVSFGVFGGLGAGCIFAPMFIMVNQYFDKKKGRAMAVATIGSGLGTLALAPLETYLLEELSYFGCMFIIGGLMLNTVVVGALFRPVNSRLNKTSPISETTLIVNGDEQQENKDSENYDKHREANATAHDTGKAADAEAQIELLDCNTVNNDSNKCENGVGLENETAVRTKANDTKGEKETKGLKGLQSQLIILKNVSFWFYGVYVAAIPCVVQTYVVFNPSLMEEQGFTKTDSALVLVVAGASDIAGRFIAGFIFDIKYISTRRWPLHCCYGFLLGLIVAANGFQDSLAGFITVAILWGLAEGGYHGQRATIVSEFIPKEQVSKSVGFMIFWQGVGNLIFPTVAGALKDVTGTYTVCFWFGGIVLCTTAVAFFLNFIVVKTTCIKCFRR